MLPGWAANGVSCLLAVCLRAVLTSLWTLGAASCGRGLWHPIPSPLGWGSAAHQRCILPTPRALAGTAHTGSLLLVALDNPGPPPKLRVSLLHSPVACVPVQWKEGDQDSQCTRTDTRDVVMLALQPLSAAVPGPCAPFHAKLVANVRVTAADHFQDVRLISLSLDGSNIRSVLTQWCAPETRP